MASLDYLFETGGGWKPKTLYTIGGNGQQNFGSITYATMTTLESVSGSGYLSYLGVSRCLEVEVWVDGAQVLSVPFDFDSGNDNPIVGASGAEQASLPPIRYESSFEIKARNSPSSTTNTGFVQYTRAIETGV